MESLERYRDKKRRRLFSGAKTIRYEKRKVNADRRSAAVLDITKLATRSLGP